LFSFYFTLISLNLLVCLAVIFRPPWWNVVLVLIIFEDGVEVGVRYHKGNPQGTPMFPCIPTSMFPYIPGKKTGVLVRRPIYWLQHVQVASRRTNLKFTPTEWNLIFEAFLRIAPENQRGIDSLKNRMKTLQSEYSNFKELTSRSGWAWDHTSHQVVAPCNEAWEALFAVLSFI
jgi:Myb/SANT-like DNA-binding domain